jgi:broad specificity phosphatase PhoE
MTLVAFIRHGATSWNEAKRIQGQTDIPLSLAGRQAVAGWRLPAEVEGFRWVASPLSRAQETARLLHLGPVETDQRLIEMAWGEWEGGSLAQLRRTLGAAMRANEAQGLDFRTAAGDSPRAVVARLADFLADVDRRGAPTVAVSHRGVLRAALALATGWTMRAPPPAGLASAAVQLFRLEAQGRLAVVRLDIPLAPP